MFLSLLTYIIALEVVCLAERDLRLYDNLVEKVPDGHVHRLSDVVRHHVLAGAHAAGVDPLRVRVHSGFVRFFGGELPICGRRARWRYVDDTEQVHANHEDFLEPWKKEIAD